MIAVHGLSFGYEKNRVLFNNLSFDITESESLVLLGQNGTGKSTLLNILCGIQKNYTGSIEINNKSIERYSIKELANLIAVVSTNSVYYQDLSVLDYLLTGFANTIGSFNVPSAAEESEAVDILQKFGKERLLHRSISSISSGEMQILRIARALLQKPKIILLDEPTANLDIKNQLMILDLLDDLKKSGYTTIIATHNPGHAIEIADKVLMLDEAQCFYGLSDEMVTEDLLSKVFVSTARVRNDKPRKIVVFLDNEEKHVLYF